MNIEHLRFFTEVMRHGSFTEVALRHELAPSSVSRAIASLEREMGVRLFQRSTRKLAPTEAGAIFYHRVNPALIEIDRAREAAVETNRGPSGVLRVAAPAVYANANIVPLLPRMAERYPQLSVELLLADSFVDLVGERIDVAIRLGSLRDSTVVARRLADMAFFVCASPDYVARHGAPSSPSDIMDHDCLLFPREGQDLDWLFRDGDGKITSVPINGRYLITNSESIRHCAVEGMGLALLPDWLVRDAIERGDLLRLLPDYEISATDFDSAVWILYPSRAYQPMKARLFVDLLTESIRPR